jgi:hypothetical protein
MSTFPNPVRQNGRLYFRRDEVENHKLALAGLPPRMPSEVIELVPAAKVAHEFGFHRRTLGRRLASADANVA